MKKPGEGSSTPEITVSRILGFNGLNLTVRLSLLRIYFRGALYQVFSRGKRKVDKTPTAGHRRVGSGGTVVKEESSPK